MKNLPEKIYLNLNMTPQEVVETKDKDFYEATKTWEITWSEECLSEHDPEYVRKDAFIEKAAKWIENNLSKYSELTDEDEYGKKLKEPVMNVFYGQAVKDFINYMKG